MDHNVKQTPKPSLTWPAGKRLGLLNDGILILFCSYPPPRRRSPKQSTTTTAMQNTMVIKYNSSRSQRTRITPAMVGGVAGRLWCGYREYGGV